MWIKIRLVTPGLKNRRWGESTVLIRQSGTRDELWQPGQQSAKLASLFRLWHYSFRVGMFGFDRVRG